MTSIVSVSGVRIVDSDRLIANIIAESLPVESGGIGDLDSPLLIAIDTPMMSGGTTALLDLFDGIRGYLQSPDCFGHPVVFYGWPHRIRAARNLIDDVADKSLEAGIVRELSALHDGSADAFLAPLPIRSLDWTQWQGKVLTRQQGRRALVSGYPSTLAHDLRNLVESIGQRDTARDAGFVVQSASDPVTRQRELEERAIKILRDLEPFIHFLDDEEREKLDSVLPCRPGEQWSKAVGPAAIAPVATALLEIYESLQATAE